MSKMSNVGLFVSSFRDVVTTIQETDNVSQIGKVAVAVATLDTNGCGDDEICERLRSGDQAALRQLMDRHAPMVLRLAMNVLSDRGEAEDVVQEVFIAVWRGRASWSGGGAKFSTWLHRVAINKAIDKRRSRRSTPESIEYITAACDAIAARDTACDQMVQVDRADVSRKLDAEISRLPQAQARALRYFYFEGRDVPAIAELTGATEQAVRSLLKRGKQALRTRLVKQRMKSSHDPFAVRGTDQQVRAGRR
jgi:RNA polymerase sigma-70 factor, ECF subfamily